MPTTPKPVTTRKATDDERKPGASIKVGDATEPMAAKEQPTDTAPKSTPNPPKDEAKDQAKGADQSPAPEAKPEVKAETPKSDDAKGDTPKADAPKKDAPKKDGNGNKASTAKNESAAEKLAAADSDGTRQGRSTSKSAAYEAAASKDKSGAAKATTPKPPSKKDERNKRYPWLVEAVAGARTLSGNKPDGKGGTLGPKTVEYAGPVQHIKVRELVSAQLKKDKEPVTAENVLKASGVKSAAKLKSIATFEADKDEMAPLQGLGKLMKNPTPAQKKEGNVPFSEYSGTTDGWAVGRYLAAILYTWIDELRKAEAAAKREAKKANGAKNKAKAASAA